MSKIHLIRAIKQAPDGFTFHNPNYAIKNWLEILTRGKCITLKQDITADGVFTWQAIYNVKLASPKAVYVSYWRTGKRAGKFSQAAYPVVATKGDWITYELAPGTNHTVKSIYTKVA